MKRSANKTDKQIDLALARFAVIAPFVCRNLQSQEKSVIRSETLKTFWEFPNGIKKLVAERTLRYWISSYESKGFDGLKTKQKSSKGSCRAISSEALDCAISLRLELSSRSARVIIAILKTKGFNENISERTLQRQLKLKGCSWDSLNSQKGIYQRWEQDNVNDLWQCDSAIGPAALDAQREGRMYSTKLIIVIDDASRKCVHAMFYWDEKSSTLQSFLKEAIQNCGKPRRFLFDNGPSFRSRDLAVSCAELGIEISFCQPYSPTSKGKIERMIGTLKRDFYAEVENIPVESIGDLNLRLHKWVQAYNARSHKGIGTKPIERWTQQLDKISMLEQDVLDRAFTSRVQRKVNERTATITIGSNIFQASCDLAGHDVEVRCCQKSEDQVVEIWKQDRYISNATRIQIGKNVNFELRQLLLRTKSPLMNRSPIEIDNTSPN